MAKILPPLGKIVDVVMKVSEGKLLTECLDCGESMIVRSIIVATAVDNPDMFSINHNLQCPSCKGYAYIGLGSKL
jgi:hypothetical protein